MIAKILGKIKAYNDTIRNERDRPVPKQEQELPKPKHYVPVCKVIVAGGNTYTSWEANSHNNNNRRIPDGEHTLYIKEEFAPR
jgi:hypothetical protein